MAEYRKKLEADIRCPLEYGLWWQMEIAYYMRAFCQQKTANIKLCPQFPLSVKNP